MENLKRKRVVVTGATGTIAKYLIPYLLEQGFEVTSLSRRKPHTNGMLGSRLEVGELTDPNYIDQSLADADIVIHTAALTRSASPSKLYQSNELVTQTIVRSIAKLDVSKFIFLSSDLAASPRGPYGKSKLACEKIIKSANLNDYTILRLSPFIGGITQEENSTFAGFIRSVINHKRVWLPNGGKFPVAPIFAQDLCILIKLIIQSEVVNNQTYVATGQTCQLDEFLRSVAQHYASKLSIGNIPLLPILSIATLLDHIPGFKHPMIESILSLKSSPSSDLHKLQKEFDFSPSSIPSLLTTLRKN